MDKRFVAFLVISFGLLMGYQLLLGALGVGPKPAAQQPPAPNAPVAAAKDQPADGVEAEAEADPAPAVVAPVHWPERRVSLGSLDPGSPFQMLVTLHSRGAAVERIELNQPRYSDLPQYDDVELEGGYIGHLASSEAGGTGVTIHAVGAGTPAAKAGLQPGDVVTQLGSAKIRTPRDLEAALKQHAPDQSVEVRYSRGGDAAVTAAMTPIKHPLSVVRPEQRAETQDPLSMLVDLSAVDGQAPGGDNLREANWELVESTPSLAEFRMTSSSGLIVRKRYELIQVADKDVAGDARGYELKFLISIENPTEQNHKVAYRLDGPTGLPTEAWWYGSKISPNWGGAGIRDVVGKYLVSGRPVYNLMSATSIAKHEKSEINSDYLPLIYAGVDAQYFSAVLSPQRELTADVASDPWFASLEVLRVGPVPDDTSYRKVVNTSFRLTSNELAVNAGETLRHDYRLFAGPKAPDVLAASGPRDQAVNANGLSDLLQYGWFGWVARPMSRILHFFHDLTGNYGIAIIMLTVLVRSCMFPISRKQAIGAQKMQMLQPEMKKIAEKYKSNPEQRMKAQQELFRKHNYNPLAGCLPLFLQLPIFIGLYRSLMVDVELRQAPLIPGLEWCSNLAAPDMLWNWTAVMPGFIEGFLGPHLNVLPLITVGLFLWQQKLFMPPPTDPQAELQQKMMQYMMIFMAFMFYHVAAGLCIYFIASSLWGIAERKLLPKTIPAGNSPATMTVIDVGGEPKNKAVEAIKSIFQNGKDELNGAEKAKRRRERGKNK